jgi:multiple sugar transport system ATP-binding protein
MVFERGGLRVTLPADIAAKLGAADGREVVLGLRAEDVVESGALQAGASLSGRVLSVLPVGSDQFLEMEVEGCKLFLRLGKECRYREGDNATLAINLNRIHLFDQQSTQSLLWS